VPKATHIVVTIDNFIKWIKAWPDMKITFEQAVKIVINIIHHFGGV
jgi:uncharacterized ubiquitin-like protein YukD